MMLERSSREFLLQCVSEQMIRHPRSSKFMQWVCQYLIVQMNPEHVSIALYDPKTRVISIEFSEGKRRIPPRLVSLDPSSDLIRWFEAEEGDDHSNRCLRRIVTIPYLSHSEDPYFTSMLEELMRYHTEVFLKIETHNNLAGYLMIGKRQTEKPFRGEDVIFFQTLANDIAIEIEKEEYYCSSQYDSLTGLLNRNSLETAFQFAMKRANEHKTALAVALLDIDDFKKINDGYGHIVGDQILKVVAEIVWGNVRKTDLAFRYGGEEFLILLPMSVRNPFKKITAPEFYKKIISVMERLRRAAGGRPVQCLSHNIAFTFSIGLTFFQSGDVKSPEELIREADSALYYSKYHGKNRLTVYRQVPSDG